MKASVSAAIVQQMRHLEQQLDGDIKEALGDVL